MQVVSAADNTDKRQGQVAHLALAAHVPLALRTMVADARPLIGADLALKLPIPAIELIEYRL